MGVTLDGIRDIRLYQHKEGYRFSVDALLVYSFVNLKQVRTVVDLGAGSGIIGLLLARKYTGAKVILVELQESLCRLAKRNIALNACGDRVEVLQADIREIRQQFDPLSCDLAVSNPPFRRPRSGRISRGEEKAVARHEIALNLENLAETASYLLRSRGRFCMIFLPERILEVIDALRLKRLEPKRIRFVHNDCTTESKMVLIEAVKNGRAGLKIEQPLFIYNRNGSYTDEVNRLYGRF